MDEAIEMSEKMRVIEFSVPAAMLRKAEAIGRNQGMSGAALHRAIWLAGLPEMAEKDNKLRINERLDGRVQLDRLAELVIELTENPDDPELRQQAAAIAKQVKEEKR